MSNSLETLETGAPPYVKEKRKKVCKGARRAKKKNPKAQLKEPAYFKRYTEK